jgi:hypothetical protein
MTSFVVTVLFAMLLVAGCAGDRTDGQVAVDAATSIAANPTNQSDTTTATRKVPQATAGAGSSTSNPSVKGAPPTTKRQRSSASTTGPHTTKPKPPTKPSTSQPVEKPKLTVIIDDNVNAGGAVQVDPGGNCTSSCSYTFPKGTSITLKVTKGLEVLTDWEVSGGQSTCDGRVGECSLTLNDDTTVTLIFND